MKRKTTVHPDEESTGVNHIVIRRGEGDTDRIDFKLAHGGATVFGAKHRAAVKAWLNQNERAPGAMKLGEMDITWGPNTVTLVAVPSSERGLLQAHVNPTYQYSSIHGLVVQANNANVCAFFQRFGVEAGRTAAFPVTLRDPNGLDPDQLGTGTGKIVISLDKVPIRPRREVVSEETDETPCGIKVKLALKSVSDHKPTFSANQLKGTKGDRARLYMLDLPARTKANFLFLECRNWFPFHKSRENDWYCDVEGTRYSTDSAERVREYRNIPLPSLGDNGKVPMTLLKISFENGQEINF